jgi:hypothetical protein
MKKLTIITPSCRPANLIKIKDTINFDYVDEWIIVYDESKVKENPRLFSENAKIKEYLHTSPGISGNPQRNYGLDMIQNKNTYLYFLDDDNIIHHDLYSLLSTMEDDKLYTFDQDRPVDVFPYKRLLTGDNIKLGNIDTAMFLIDYNLCKNIRWVLDKYYADGLYIVECYTKNKNKWVYVNKTMAYYNFLTR